MTGPGGHKARRQTGPGLAGSGTSGPLSDGGAASGHRGTAQEDGRVPPGLSRAFS
jgi:hypothetical protein